MHETSIASPQPVQARLRPLTGWDEIGLDTDEPSAATALLRRLFVGGDEDVKAEAVDALTLAEHDRLLAALFDRLYGDRVEARSRCVACGEGIEIVFSLAELTAATEAMAEIKGPYPDGTYTTADGRRFRPATVGDLAAATRIGGQQGLAAIRAACVVEGDPEAEPDALDAALETAAPTLSRDVAANCPHCAMTQSLRFDLPRFLIETLARERPFLLREMHLLASTYGWSQAEIMALTRDDRRMLARLCEAERAFTQQRRAA